MAGQFVHTGSGTGLGIIGPGTGFDWVLYRILWEEIRACIN